MGTKGSGTRPILPSQQSPGRSNRTVRGLLGRLADWEMGFVLPAVVVMVLLVIFPTLYALGISLTRWHMTEATPATFSWLKNYQFLLTDSRFWQALGRTAIFTATSTVATLIFGMALALLLNRALPGKNFFRTLLIVPMIVTPVVVGLTWRFMYNPELGMFNYFLSLLGLPKFVVPGKGLHFTCFGNRYGHLAVHALCTAYPSGRTGEPARRAL